jgi:hypothetical protein
MVPLAGREPYHPAAKYAQQRETLRTLVPADGIALPDWSPRMPIGLYVGGAAFTIKSLTVTPLP